MANIYAACDHCAVDGGVNRGVIQIGLRHGHGRLLLLNLGGCLGDLCLGRGNGRRRRVVVGFSQIELLLAHHAILGESYGAFVIGFGLHLGRLGFLQVGFRRGQAGFSVGIICLRLEQSAFKKRRVNLGDDLSLSHARIEICVEARNSARHLRANLNCGYRIDSAGSLYDGTDVTAIDLGGEILSFVAALKLKCCQYGDGGDDQNGD